MTKYDLVPVSPSNPGLACQCLMPPPEQTEKMAILVVAFEGDYPDGSRGNDHGSYIASETMRGLHAFSPDCIVLDFRGLSYRWGNTMLAVFQNISQYMDDGNRPDDVGFPIVVVTSTKCRAGILSLLTPDGISSPPWHFSDIDDAITYAVAAARRWLKS